MSLNATTHKPVTRSQSKKAIMAKQPVKDNNFWKLFPKDKVPFLAVPPEIHLKIFTFLNPIDAVCLSLVNNYIYGLSAPQSLPLDTGSPHSDFPVPLPPNRGCHHCVPVLYYPAHCELHYHLRSFIPHHLKFCSGSCGKFTACEDSVFSDAKEICGTCGIPYRKRYERGRRMLDMQRPGEKQLRLRKWYNG